ncbi:haloacid dehalogenase-like hydrolase domain-containing protein 2 [Ephemerocybe angulata]|uniref:Haloacid dehalogenase-like hydrolase domain-containing protein 2 n=1 Tax=Ephemerocybe angulata TaxID=980116 RepID=A0A8H6HVM3_9AGAR|nr:haloacid dehalogenase-like hydrolase domain-containing protein 2 [Tulosesus angulatus]
MTGRPFIKALLIDISGTLQIGSTPTPRAVEAINRLRESNVPFRLCSNSSKESTASLVKKLNGMGFDFVTDTTAAGKKEVWTSIGSVAQTVKDRGPYMLLSNSAREEVSPPEPEPVGDAVQYDGVIVGLAPALFDYNHLNTAFRILKGEDGRAGGSSRREVPLIATHKAKYIQKDDPPGLSLGPGPFVTALEEAAGCKAYVVGKPTKTFFQLVIGDFSSAEVGESDGRIAVIGDDVEADLGGGALELGLWRILVKTGKYRPGDVLRPGVRQPDEVYEDFASFVDSLLLSQDRTHSYEDDSQACK